MNIRKLTWSKLIGFARHYYSLYIVRALWVHWFNPLYTLYFNLIFFPFKQAVRFPVFVYGWPRLFAQTGHLRCIGSCYPGMVKLNCTIAGAPQYSGGNVELNLWGDIIFRGKCVIGSGSRLTVCGLLDLGADTKIMNFCNITAESVVRIGAQSWIVHRCQVLDSNYHYIADFKHGMVKKRAHPITIGHYCWVCNSSTITGGAVIPNKIIVASNSLVNKDMSNIPEESIIGGIPAKLVAIGYRRIESHQFEGEVNRYFMLHPEADMYPIPEGVGHDICDRDW